VDEQVEHVVALAAHLEPHLHPVQLGGLEKLGRLERLEQVPFIKIMIYFLKDEKKRKGLGTNTMREMKRARE
jgi:hypothetical protein